MCYEDLRADAVLDRSIPSLLRAENQDAVVNGLEAAVLVALVLSWHGTPVAVVAASSLLAVLLGTLLHQVVLVVGVVLLRRRARHTGRPAQPG